jgi:hypothetical protein
MSIFKVNKLTRKNIIEKIYVFNGTNENNKNNVFDNIELNYIEKNNVEVIFINEMIYIDDNIGTIKLKIFQHCLAKAVSMSELYLFCLKRETLNPITLYQNLTQNDSLPLTKVRLNQMLLNIYEDDDIINNLDFNIENKEKYSFDDILKLNLTERDYLVGKILGQKIIFTNEYPIIADPFLVTEYDTLLENSRRELTTLSTNLLLDTGTIYNNNIYLCLAEDVFNYSEQNNISTEYSTKIYYPFLYRDNINTIDQLFLNKNKLIENTLNVLTIDTEKNFENIDMFYNVYKYKTTSEKFFAKLNNTGITFIKLVMYPEFKIKIPIDVIFKLIHATENNPLIKFNPESRQENIYRLYADKISTDGRKIPFLNKATIFKLIKNIGKTKTVAIYTNVKYNGEDYYMSCEFAEDGSITIYPITNFTKPIFVNTFETINNIIRLTVNPLIEEIKPFFAQSGLELKLFDSIDSPNIEIRTLNYQSVYLINQAININKYMGCLSSIFVIESGNFKKGIQMRFKRVSNFNKRDSQEAFVIEKIDQGVKFDEIVEELKQNYDNVTEETAIELIAKIRNELEVIRGANKRRSLMIKINPGFKTNINFNPITTELTISIEGINNIYYLNTIPIYLDSFMRITQDINSTDVKKTLINKLCSGKEIEDIEFGQITAQSEQVIGDNELPSIENESPIYPEEQGENMEDLLAMLGYAEEEETGLIGGQNSDSEESLPSELLSELSELEPEDEEEELEEPIVDEEELKEPIVEEEELEEPIVDEEELEEPIVDEEELKEPIVEEEELEEPIDKEPIVEEELKEPIVEEEELEVDVQPIYKKAKKFESTVRDITGMNLRYPNPFTNRLEQRAPELFIRAKNEKIDLYTRMCPFSVSDRRQPVILTKEEKEEMLREHPDTVNEEADFIEYSTDPNDPSKKFYYTCPRYWCLLTDKMVTEKDILDGKCGPKVSRVEDAIIPKTADKIPKDRYVYQFYESNKTKYPGFHKEKTPSGICIPCCYSKWTTKEMKNRRDICQGKFKPEESQVVSAEEEKIEEVLRRDLQEAEQYIKGPEKYPLGEHRWGFLPVSVQKFLHEVNEDCQVSKTDTTIKLNHTCLLRHGVETNSNQSFISCIASALFYGQEDKETKQPLIKKFLPNSNKIVPNIKEMKEIIINALNLDNFIKLQNGDLIEVFAKQELDVDIYQEKYINSILYNKLTNKEDNNNIDFFRKIVQAYENYITYLRDNTIYIDYTYLWDLVCMPNPKLFINGINLIILEMPEDDITNNIELVCPTNHYSTHIYDARKKSLILIKRENFFEPIYGYKNEEKRLLVTTMFSEYDRYLPQTLRSVFTKIIKPTLGEKCRAFISRPKEYRFKQPPLLDNLIYDLRHKKYKIIKQILNYQGKVIGVIARNKRGLEGFIPCFPSSLSTIKTKDACNDTNSNNNKCEYDYEYVSDDIWKSYNDTLIFLKYFYEFKNPIDINKAECSDDNYFCRVVEDELVIGFLTNTNQFIRINNPIPVSNVDDNIKTVTSNDMLVADMKTLVSSKVDDKRVDFMKRIQLETNFYNVFRNTIRILFNDYINSDKRKAIQEECNKKNVLYIEKLDNVVELLRELVDETIVFVEDGFDYRSINENEINNCISKVSEKCEEKTMICKIIDNKCVLLLPKENLVTKTDNESYYYKRMADELIRYNRIKSFIFKPQSYLSFSKIQYNLRNNEMIVLQSLLSQEFFEGLIPATINKYAKFNSYDTTQPIITQTYSNEILLDDIINPSKERDCFATEPKIIESAYWRKCFPRDYSEVEYNDSKFCLLYLLVDIVKKIKNIDITVEQLKEDLIDQYRIITENFTNKDRTDKIIDILREQGQYDANQLQDETITFEQLIIQDGFIPVNFDLWILLVRYQIPSIFISKRLLSEIRFNTKEFVCYTDINKQTNKYVFIVTPAMYRRKRNKFPFYKLILNDDKDIEIDILQLNESQCLDNIKEAIKNYYTIEEYIDNIFTKDKTTIYKPRQIEERELEFEIIDDEKEKEDEGEEFEIIPKPKKKKFKKKQKIEFDIIENEEEELPIEQQKVIEKRKTKKKRITIGQVTRRQTKKKTPIEFEIVDEEEEEL